MTTEAPPRRLRLAERDFAAQIIEYARLCGWEVYGVLEQRQYARRTSKGFPDLLLVRGEEMRHIEVKGDGGRLTKDQERWLKLLKGVRNVKACAAWPQDWQAIEEELR